MRTAEIAKRYLDYFAKNGQSYGSSFGVTYFAEPNDIIYYRRHGAVYSLFAW